MSNTARDINVPTKEDEIKNQLDAVAHRANWEQARVAYAAEIEQYGDQRELEGRTKELETFAVPVEERRTADSFYGSIYVTKMSRIDERIDELKAKQQEGK